MKQNSAAGQEADDLWDFGTVRHVSRQSTIGRKDANNHTFSSNTNAYSQMNTPPSPTRTRATAPSYNGAAAGPRRTGSEISLQSSITAKGETLPPLPPAASQSPPASSFSDTQATIRHAEPPVQSNVQLRLDEEEEDEDYGELLEPGPYPPMEPQHDNNRHLQDFPDTAMLDTVVLPAIASVSLKIRW